MVGTEAGGRADAVGFFSAEDGRRLSVELYKKKVRCRKCTGNEHGIGPWYTTHTRTQYSTLENNCTIEMRQTAQKYIPFNLVAFEDD
jgi:hypothetical protein